MYMYGTDPPPLCRPLRACAPVFPQSIMRGRSDASYIYKTSRSLAYVMSFCCDGADAMATLRSVMLLQRDVGRAARFYSEGLGLRVAVLTERWAELHGGGNMTLTLKAVDGCDTLATLPGLSE